MNFDSDSQHKCIQFHENDPWKCGPIEFPNFHNNDFNVQEFKRIIAQNFNEYIKEITNKLNSDDKDHFLPHQIFVSRYSYDLNMDSAKDPIGNLLIYHQMGSGKSLTSILIGEAYRAYQKYALDKKIVVVTSKSVIPGYRKEFQRDFLDQVIQENEYKYNTGIKPPEKASTGLFTRRKQTRWDKTYKRNLDKRIDNYWDIMSHQAFVGRLMEEDDSLKNLGQKLKQGGHLIIIDEVQNVVSEEGITYKRLSYFMNMFCRKNRIILLSATPMYDKAYEIGLTLNLLNPRLYFPRTRAEFDKTFWKPAIKDTETGELIERGKPINKGLFYIMAMGYISYFSGGDPKDYPAKRIIKIKHTMGSIQQREYIKALFNDIRISDDDNENTENMGYFVKSRQILNIALEKGPETIDELKPVKYRTSTLFNDIQQFSTKLYFLQKWFMKDYASKGKVLIYSDMLQYGLNPVKELLLLLGYEEYKGKGLTHKKHFFMWTGETKEQAINSFQTIFNSVENDQGEQIKVVLGSRAIMEGVSFKSIRHVHILNPWWNETRIDQVIARAVRYKSHDRLPPNQQFVNVYKHISVYSSYPKKITVEDAGVKYLEQRTNKLLLFNKKHSKNTLDQRLDIIGRGKRNKVRQFELLCKQSAIDCELNKENNKIRMIEHYKFVIQPGYPLDIQPDSKSLSYENPSTGIITKTHDQPYGYWSTLIEPAYVGIENENINCDPHDLDINHNDKSKLIDNTKNTIHFSNICQELYSKNNEVSKKSLKNFLQCLFNNSDDLVKFLIGKQSEQKQREDIFYEMLVGTKIEVNLDKTKILLQSDWKWVMKKTYPPKPMQETSKAMTVYKEKVKRIRRAIGLIEYLRDISTDDLKHQDIN